MKITKAHAPRRDLRGSRRMIAALCLDHSIRIFWTVEKRKDRIIWDRIMGKEEVEVEVPVECGVEIEAIEHGNHRHVTLKTFTK